MNNISKLILAASGVIAAMFLLISCTTTSEIYRERPYINNNSCIGIFDLIQREKAYQNPFYQQTVKISTRQNEPTCTTQNSYSLNFIEFAEKDSSLKKPEQLNAFQSLIANKDVYIIVFVHGWRIDADENSSDLAKFHTYLNYARNYLNDRCADEGRYCDTHLAGLFLGWRGRLYSEPHKGFEILEKEKVKPFYHTLVAAPTIWNRKAQSEAHATEFISLLKEIETDLELHRPDGKGDRMLVMGHSLGGNLLATGLEPIALEAIDKHGTGQEMKPLLGNLVLVINPAAEATKWTNLQEQFRKKAEISLTSGVGSPQHPANGKWSDMFPRKQRPTYIAMTSPCEWSPEEEVNGIERTSSECDRATGKLFPAAHFWRKKHRRTTIGHLMPDYSREGRIATGDPYGSTHEFIVNRGQNIKTSIQNAADAANTYCATGDGWLSGIRAFNGGWAHWDTFERPMILSKPGTPDVEVQFRRGVSPNTVTAEGFVGEKRAVAPGNTPFWNVRAHYTSFKQHTGMLSHPTWCAINQIVLDEITR